MNVETLKLFFVIILKIIFGSVEFLFAFVIAYLTIAFVCMSIRVGHQLEKKGTTIYMKSDGIHTDFVFPVQSPVIDWRKIISPEDTKGKDTTLKYIAIGWGDQGFFLNTPVWADLKASTAFDACFYLGKSAMHTNYLKELDFKFKHVQFKVSDKQYRKLIEYIQKAIKKDKHNKLDCIKNRGYWKTDSFYQTNGSYGLFNTCNSWINGELKAADLPACLWAPFNSGIFHKYQISSMN